MLVTLSKALFAPLLCLALAVTFAVTGAVAEPDAGWTERRIGDLGLMFPVGDGWRLDEIEPGIWLAALTERSETGDPLFLNTILVESYTHSDPPTDRSPSELVTDYLLWEIFNLHSAAKTEGEFAIVSLDLDEERHGATELQVLRSVKAYIVPHHPMLEMGAQNLYILFRPNAHATMTYYKIFIGRHCFFDDCTVDDLDLSAMTPLLDDLRDYSLPLN